MKYFSHLVSAVRGARAALNVGAQALPAELRRRLRLSELRTLRMLKGLNT
jgi:hypothetical protein